VNLAFCTYMVDGLRRREGNAAPRAKRRNQRLVTGQTGLAQVGAQGSGDRRLIGTVIADLQEIPGCRAWQTKQLAAAKAGRRKERFAQGVDQVATRVAKAFGKRRKPAVRR